MILWLLQSFDFSLHMVDDASASMLGVIGGWIAPIFAPMGLWLLAGGSGPAHRPYRQRDGGLLPVYVLRLCPDRYQRPGGRRP